MLKLADLCLGFDFFSELSHLRISTKTLSSSNSFALKPFFTRLSAASMPFKMRFLSKDGHLLNYHSLPGEVGLQR